MPYEENHPPKSCTCKYCTDKDHRTIAEEIMSLVETGRAGKTQIVPRIASYCMHRYWIYSFDDNEEIVIYDEKEGIYRRGGDIFLKGVAQEIINIAGSRDIFGTRSVNEIIGHIQRSTYTSRDSFEPPKNFICLKNGIYDVESGAFLPHSPDFHFLSKLQVAYDPNAKCLKIDQFLKEVLQPEDILMFEEITGYLLLRDYRFQRAFMFNGEGSNGKSTLLGILTKFLGYENVSHVPLQGLAEDKFAVSNLYQKYANIYADLSSDALNDTGVFKMLTGGDRIYADVKFKNPFGFNNFAKLLFSCNRIPLSKDNSDAFFRRWIIIDFRNKFEGKAEKRNLLAELTTPEELSGLFNRALVGLRRLLENNEFSNISSVEAMRESYIRKSDSIQAFAMDMLQPDMDGVVEKKVLWNSYLKYCGDNKVVSTSETMFYRRLPTLFSLREEQLTIEKDGIRRRERVYRGIMLNEKKTKVKVIKDVQIYRGADGVYYGGWKENDIVEGLPLTEIEFLVGNELAIIVEK